jgi:capsular exopolysaccharide synthesis family protein
MIIILSVLFFAIGTGVTLLFYYYFPSFVATSYIRVQSTNPINVMNPLERQRIEAEEIQRLLQDQALLVKSPQVLLKALEDNELRATEWYKEAQRKDREKNEDPQDLLADILNAAPVRDSNYVGVSATWYYAKEVPVIVNTVVDKYVALINQLQRDSIRDTQTNMNKELETAKNLYENKQREINDFRNTEELLSREGGEGDETLATLRAMVTEIEIDMLGKKSQWEALKEARPEDLPVSAELQHILNQDPQIFQLDQRAQAAEDDYRSLTVRYGQNHRMVKEYKARRDQAAENANTERAKKILKYQAEQIETARRLYLEAQEQALKLKDKLFQSEQEQRDKDAKYWRYQKMLEESELYKDQYEKILEQNQQLTMTLRLDKSVQIDVRSKAVAPRRRAQPKLEIWLPASAILGLGLAIGVAMLIELTDTSVRTPRDVMRQSLPILGTIPVTDDDEIEIERVETASLDAPHSILAEAFRNLRTNLFFCAPAEQQSTVLVTSPSGGNGKTTVAVNLAISVALSGRRVLLVDANFRRSALPKLFPGVPTEGLSNILIGQGRLDAYSTSTAVPGLDVLGAGPIPPNPAELLGSSYLRDLIADARTRYDQVVFDGPPLLLVSDAMVLAASVDGVIMVCQYRVTSRGALQRSATQLASMGARIFGAVLNRVETRAGGYFRKSYREFYEYHEAEEEEGGVKRPRLDASAMTGPIQPTDSPAPSGGVAETATDEAAAIASLDSPTLLSEDELAPAELDAPKPLAAADAPGPGDASAWSSTDLDQEIKELGGDLSLGEPEEFKIADDLDLGDDFTKPEKPQGPPQA